MSTRPNTTGTRGGLPGRRPLQLAEKTYTYDNEQGFRKQLGEELGQLKSNTDLVSTRVDALTDTVAALDTEVNALGAEVDALGAQGVAPFLHALAGGI